MKKVSTASTSDDQQQQQQQQQQQLQQVGGEVVDVVFPPTSQLGATRVDTKGRGKFEVVAFFETLSYLFAQYSPFGKWLLSLVGGGFVLMLKKSLFFVSGKKGNGFFSTGRLACRQP